MVNEVFAQLLGTKNKIIAKMEITTNSIFLIQILVGSELSMFVVVILGVDSEVDTPSCISILNLR